MKYKIVCAAIILSLFSLLPVHAEEKGFFSTMFNDIKSNGFEGVSQRHEIRKWYKENKGRLVITNGTERLGCKKQNDSDIYDCSFTAQLINHTNSELTALVLKIEIYNKQNNYLVTEDIATLEFSLFPTIKKTINAKFISSKISGSLTQLGENSGWNYELVAYLPGYLDDKFRDSNWSNNTLGIFRNEKYDWLVE